MKIKHIFLASLVVFLPFSCQAQDEQEQEEQSQEVTPTVSKLSFPNTFTPNDDNYNDKFKAKECPADMPQISLFFDFGGNPSNTEVTLSKIYLEKK